MRVVVTGATGNVGTALLRALADEGRVDAVVGWARRRPAIEPPKTTFDVVDVARDELAHRLGGADAVVHLAWQIQPARRPRQLHETNVVGTRRVLDAAAAAGVGAVVVASSVGAYSPGPKDRRVDESWPTDGVPTSSYSLQKAYNERVLDAFEGALPEVRVVRMRPALIFSSEAGSEIFRYFLGGAVPRSAVRRSLVPLVPRHPDLRVQALHSDDAAQAYRQALVRNVRGAFNLAAEPVLDGEVLGRILSARPVPVPSSLMRAAVSLSWRLRVQRTNPGWVDMGFSVPLLDSARARDELGWTPKRSAEDAVLELVEGISEGKGVATPPMRPAA